MGEILNFQEVETTQFQDKEIFDHKRICLVDDDEDLREVLAENLRSLGYLVSSYASGKEALLKWNNTKEKKADLMILDYALPDMNGGELFESMRSELDQHNVPVIFLSGEKDLSKLVEGHKPQGYLSKPLKMRELRQLIQSTIRHQRSS